VSGGAPLQHENHVERGKLTLASAPKKLSEPDEKDLRFVITVFATIDHTLAAQGVK